jgi:hypothetical protein
MGMGVPFPDLLPGLATLKDLGEEFTLRASKPQSGKPVNLISVRLLKSRIPPAA